MKMKTVRVFGKTVKVKEEKSNKDSVEFTNDKKILIATCERPAVSLLREFLEDLLYCQLCRIYDGIRRQGKIELFGNLDFEILERIDRKKDRIAKLKGNKILVKLSAVASPESALKYVIAHEIAHVFTKRHSKKFWRVVETIYPNFKDGEKLFAEYRRLLIEPLDLR